MVIPSAGADSTVRRTAVDSGDVARLPGYDRARRAQRPFPSMLIATWNRSRPSRSGCSGSCHRESRLLLVSQRTSAVCMKSARDLLGIITYLHYKELCVNPIERSAQSNAPGVLIVSTLFAVVFTIICGWLLPQAGFALTRPASQAGFALSRPASAKSTGSQRCSNIPAFPAQP